MSCYYVYFWLQKSYLMSPTFIYTNFVSFTPCFVATLVLKLGKKIHSVSEVNSLLPLVKFHTFSIAFWEVLDLICITYTFRYIVLYISFIHCNKTREYSQIYSMISLNKSQSIINILLMLETACAVN